jgi:hypothetical protein
MNLRVASVKDNIMRTKTVITLVMIASLAMTSHVSICAEWRSDWEKALQGAKTEGKIVLAIPPSAELRKNWSRC